MDTGSEEKKLGGGRGRIIMMLKKKAEEEAAAKAAASTLSSSIPQSTSQQPITPITTPPQSEPIQEQSVPPTTGRGRAHLIALMQKKQQTKECSTPAHLPKPIQSYEPDKPSASTGVTAAMHGLQIKPAQSMQRVQDNTGVLGPLSDISSKGESSFVSQVPATKQGTSGQRTSLAANYINITRDPDKGLFLYEVKFNPDIDSRPLRRKLLNEHLETIGRTKIFDGALLYVPRKLEAATFQSAHPIDGSSVNLTLVFKKEQTLSQNIPFFNVLLGRVMRALKLIRIGQHNFNPRAIKSIPQHKLEVWPGFVTAISEYEGGLKLCIDAKHRVMRTETVRDLIISQHRKPNFKAAVMQAMQNITVLTRYNNNAYRIDDIDWTQTPMSTFKKNDTEMSLIDYYKSHWNIQIQDKGQPLLIHRAKQKTPSGETEERVILLVPELCYIAGLTDDIRSDFRIMKDLDAVTKVSPNERRDGILHFICEINKSDVAREIFSEWGLRLALDLTEFPGRILDPETIILGNNIKHNLTVQRPADWGAVVTKKEVLRTPHLRNWFLMYCHKDAKYAREFSAMLRNVSITMGINVNDPKMITLQDDRIDSYIRELKQNIQNDVNLAVVIFPTNRTDRYTAVKRICCVEMPIPSQVIMSRTISRADKLKSITEKIALQINCKLGGALWSLNVPLENFMICGIDVYHGGAGSSSRGSVAGFVASLDKALSTWHSKVCLQGPNQEIIDLLQSCFVSAVKAYYKRNTRYPDRIVVYRDGVGEGQLQTVKEYEVKQLLLVLKSIEPNYKPKLSVIIVHKRINTRLFVKMKTDLGNPPPGTVVDSVITKSNLYDFFLVSQNVRQGTVSPTHYIVVYDSANMKAEHIQRLTYKLCHLYYNWPGTIKVPAPCQYAHKLVYLVGQSFCLEPHASLADTLFYL